MTFQKGQSGNPKGRPPEEESLTWLMKQYLKSPSAVGSKTHKQLFIEKAYAKAVEEGDAASIKLIWNYIDGMPSQSVDVTSLGEQVMVSLGLPKVKNNEE